MKYEVYIDILKGDKKILSDYGDVVGITKDLEKILSSTGVSEKTFSDFLIEYVREKHNFYSVYSVGKSITEKCPNFGFFLQLWITNAQNSSQHFLGIFNYSGDIYLSLTRFDFSDQLIQNVISKSVNFLDCLRIYMPFLYRFVIFELFNSFKKISEVKFEKLIGNSLVISDNKDRGLIWEIDSTQVEYTNSLSKKILSELKK